MRTLLFYGFAAAVVAVGFVPPSTSVPAVPALPEAAPADSPAGSTTAAPRDELRPAFSYDPVGGPKKDGALVITADGREGLHGWFQKTFPVSGGRHYRFQAVRKVHDVAVPRRSAVARILWQDSA